MNRIGIPPNRIAAVIAALLIATTGIATVLAQALGPAGPSPAGDNAEVVTQALVDLPEGDAVWRIRNIQIDGATDPISNPYPAFVTTEGVPVLVEDRVTGLRQRIAAGEATVITPFNETSMLSVGPPQTVMVIDVLPVDEATLSGSSGRISSPFGMSAGTYDVDFIRIDLDEGETSTVPMGNGPSQIVVRSGQAEIEAEDESFTMAAGSDRLASGELNISANTDDTVILVVRIGPQIDSADEATPAPSTPIATPAATPAPTEAPATPAPATPAATPAPTEPAEPPQDIDSDEDGIVNSEEIANGTNPDNPDSDGDALTDGQELELGTDALNPDTDDDGVTDGQEIDQGTDPLNLDTDGDVLYDGGEAIYLTDPLAPDTDGDGITDGDEVYFSLTNPTAADTDGDGVNDFNDPTPNGGAPANGEGGDGEPAGDVDTDNDGLVNARELQVGSNPFVWDTDGDGVNDSNEVAAGSNPNDPDSF